MCDTVVVVGRDHVLFAKNSDRDANEAQVLEWKPRRQSPPGAAVRCTWIAIPDAATTNAVVLSRPFWMWGAEIGANEHGVCIGNEAVFTREPYARSGLTGMDLLRLALERARTAEGAVDVLVDLLERHGQGGGCGYEQPSFTYHNSFLVADASEAWVLETADRRFATERVAAGVRAISNGLSIPGFADRYADRLRTRVAAAERRRALTGALPPSADVHALMTALRSHGRTRWPRYSPVNGALGAPCAHAGGLLTATQTTASWVSMLDAGGARHWATATAAPCTGLFKPVRVGEQIDLGPAPDGHDDGRSLWWRHERLHRAALRDPARALPRLTRERDDVEARWLAEPPDSVTAFAIGDELLERWTVELATLGLDDRRPWWVRRYWHIRDEHAHRMRGDRSGPVASIP